ncbi:MAG TPA: methyltransferase domain-containing protein [Pirellulaceae bacterium]
MWRIHRFLLTVLALPMLTSSTLTPTGWSQTTEETKSPEDRSTTAAIPPGINEPFLDPKLDPEDWRSKFEVESREIFAHREAVVRALQPGPGMRVADVGAGTGLFLRPLSEAVGVRGRVYAIDISPRLTEFMRRRARDERLHNVQVVLSQEDSITLPDQSVDLVFVCDTYHHFQRVPEMLTSIRFALRPGGHMVLIDFERIPGTSREWVIDHVRADKATFRQEIERSGFVLVEEVPIPGFRENYFLRFRRP